MFIVIACAFIWWKSMLSASFIEFANGVLPFSIGRTVDPSDLIALVVLPIVFVLGNRARSWRPRRVWEWSVVAVSLFAFTASTGELPTNFVYASEWAFDMPAESLKAAIRAFDGPTRLEQESAQFLSIEIPWRCSFGLTAETRVLERNASSVLILDRIASVCDPGRTHPSELLLLFEDSVISKLRP